LRHDAPLVGWDREGAGSEVPTWGGVTINRVTLPLIEVPPVAGGPFGCDGDTMSLGFTSGLADAAGVYTRIG